MVLLQYKKFGEPQPLSWIKAHLLLYRKKHAEYTMCDMVLIICLQGRVPFAIATSCRNIFLVNMFRLRKCYSISCNIQNLFMLENVYTKEG